MARNYREMLTAAAIEFMRRDREIADTLKSDKRCSEASSADEYGYFVAKCNQGKEEFENWCDNCRARLERWQALAPTRKAKANARRRMIRAFQGLTANQ